MPEPETIQRQHDFLRKFWAISRQRTLAEANATERLRSDTAGSEATLNTARQKMEAERNKAIADAEKQRKERHEAAQSIVDNVIKRDKWIQQQEWFRKHGHCLECGEKLGLRDGLFRRNLCSGCRDIEKHKGKL